MTRLLGILLIISFFLPCWRVGFNFFEGPMTVSQFMLVQKEGVHLFGLLLPIMSAFVFWNPTRMNNAAAGLFAALNLFLLGPANPDVTYLIGFWATLLPGVILFLSFPFVEGE
tara:strand:- start:102 stop:440 length:339 start_codon:yes stop_codon:yes gene_type:complete